MDDKKNDVIEKTVCTFYYIIIVYKNMPQIIPTQKHIKGKPKVLNCNCMFA